MILGSFGGLPNHLPDRRKLFLVQKFRFLVDVDAIGADLLGITAVFMRIFLCLWNQVFTFIVWIPADPVQEGEAIEHRKTNLPQAEALRARAPNSTAALGLPRAMGRT